MAACDPAQPSTSSVANDSSTASRGDSPSSARQSSPFDINARTPKGMRSWELNPPVGHGQQPDISGAPPAPSSALGLPRTARLVLEQRSALYGIHPNLLEEFPLPVDAPTPRPPPRDHPFDPVDDALTSQGYAPRSSRPMVRHGSVAPWDDSSDGGSGRLGESMEGGENGEGEDEVMGHPDRRSLSAAEDRWDSGSDGGDLEHGGGGKRVERQRSPSGMSIDEPEPAHQSRQQARQQQPAPPHPPPGQAPAEANRARYPAYDESGRRIGLEHTRTLQSPPQATRSYYRPRTHNYPGPNVRTADLPHVMSLDMRISPSAIAPTGPSQSMMFRSNVRPDTLHPSAALQGQFKAPLPPNATPPPPPPNPPIRDPSGVGRDAVSQVQGPAQAQAQGRSRVSAPGTVTPPGSSKSVSDTQSQRASEPPPSPSPAPEQALVDAPARNPRVPDFEVETPDIPDPGPALRELLGLGEDEEVSLYTLEDPLDGEKPGWPYPTLIKLAIYGSPNKRLTLQEIYAAVENRFKWFRDSPDKAWQGSIRHQLSLNKCFRLIPRPISEPGKGNFWVVDYSHGEGNKRQRKRNKKKTKAELRRLAEDESARQRGDISDSSEEPEERQLASTSKATPASGAPRASQPSKGPASRAPPATRPSQPSQSTQKPASPSAEAMPPPPPPMIARPMSAPRGGLPPELWPKKADRRHLMHLVNTPRVGTAPIPPGTPVPGGSHDTPSTIATQLDDAHIDPLLRDSQPETGHVVGDGRARPSLRTTRMGAHSPYSVPTNPRLGVRRGTSSESPSPSSQTSHHAMPAMGPARFGQQPIPPHPGHPVPSPRMNWAPYGAPTPLPHTHRPLRNAIASNMLGLSGNAPAGPSTTTFSIPGPGEPLPSIPSESDMRGSSEEEQPEGVRRSKRVRGAKRKDYRDSRGAVYASASRQPISSDSEDDL